MSATFSDHRRHPGIADPTHRSVLARLPDIAQERKREGLHRSLRSRGPVTNEHILDLASNDYLGLHHNPHVIAAARDALTAYGLGSTGSRLVTGATDIHDELENELANFTGFESATVLSSGYLANLAAITSPKRAGELMRALRQRAGRFDRYLKKQRSRARRAQR